MSYATERQGLSLLKSKSLEWTKLKVFSDLNSDVAKMIKFVLKRVENVVEKGENAGNHHFSPQYLLSSSGSDC